MTLRRLLVAVLVAAFALSGPRVASAATEPLQVIAVETTGSEGAAVVAPPASLGGRDLSGASWSVSVGDEDVEVRVEPVSNAHLEVVLALDTSGSMQGAAMEAAKAAAEAFVDSLPAAAQVSVVSFSSAPTVLVPLSTDRGAVIAAIRGLRAQGETALYDALALAAQQFSTAGDARRELVVLSDGGDTVSTSDVNAAIEAMTSRKITGYVASLVTDESAAGVLDDIAAKTGGRVVSATDAAAIRSVFGNIGAVLTNQYRLRFPLRGEGQTTISLEVVDGETTASADRVIELASAPRSAAPTSGAARVIDGPGRAWMKPLGLGSFALGIFALTMYVFVPARKRRITSRWIAEHAGAVHGDSSIQELAHRATDMAERSLQRRGWASRLDVHLERAGVPLRPGEFALVLVGLEAMAWFVGSVLFGPLFGVLFIVAGAFIARTVLRMKVNRRRNQFEAQLGDTLQLLSGSLRAGYGLAQALDAVAKNAESPTAEEFNRLTMETRVGRSLPDALGAVATRIGSQDFDWVVEAIAINREIGGDLTELLDRAATTIRERENVRRQVKALSAEGRLSGYVLGGIPVGLFLYMKLANPEYVGELTSSPIGWGMLGMATLMMVLGGLWMRKLVQVQF
jgi:tight adherence protein B